MAYKLFKEPAGYGAIVLNIILCINSLYKQAMRTFVHTCVLLYL